MLAIPLIVVVALGLACAVVWPLLGRDDTARPAAPAGVDEVEDRRRDLRESLERSLAAIREIEFDHGAGHLSDEDFAALDAAERARAVDLIGRLDHLDGG
jgi:hypothetical protein